MRRSQRKVIAWLLLAAVSINPLAGVLAMAAVPGPPAAGCQVDLAASADSGVADDAGLAATCAQHHACTTSCQFAPLQPAALPPMHLELRPCPGLSSEPETLVTRFLERIERPPPV